jgi:thioredoxin reductase
MKKSYRGMLVKIIVKSFVTDYLFDPNDELKETLQEKLNLNLKFDTKVSEIEIKNKHNVGKISFEDETGEVRVIEFTITEKNRYTKKINQFRNDVYTIEEWEEVVNDGDLCDSDGVGYWVREGLKSEDDVFSTPKLDATHVVWYNK